MAQKRSWENNMFAKMSVKMKIFFTAWIVYVLFMYIKPESMSSNLVDLAMSLVDNGNVYLRYSTSSIDISFVNGKYISGHLPGASMLVVPLYLLAKPFFFHMSGENALVLLHVLSIIFISSVSGALITVIFYSFLQQIMINEKSRLILTFIYAFGTMNFGYSTSYYKGIIATLCVFYAFYIVFLESYKRQRSLKIFFAAGLLLGMAAITDFSVLYIVCILFIYAVYVGGGKRGLIAILGVLIPLIFLALYFKTAFGGFFSMPYAYRVNPDPNVITYPRMYNVFNLFFSIKQGFFVYMPIMVLSAFGLAEGVRRKEFIPEMLTVILIFVIGGFYFSGYVRRVDPLHIACPHDAHMVIRYLMPICPFMLLGAAFVVNEIRRSIVYILGGVSIFFSYLAAQAGLLPYGLWQIVYALKVFVTGFGMPTMFSQTLPHKFNIMTLHTYMSKPDNLTIAQLLTSDNKQLLFNLITNQLLFFGMFAGVAGVITTILFFMWRDTTQHLKG
ncbi:MAG: hypothetical protein PHW46_04485 [Candidatus Omnitrophica bacterium]|nr:hypothetical protein [Candidatus Omnitrophota bacterium]